MSLIEPEDPKPEKKNMTDLQLADTLEQLAAKASSTEVSRFVMNLAVHLREQAKSPFDAFRPAFCSQKDFDQLFFGRCPYCNRILCKAHMGSHLGEHGFFSRGA